MCQLVWLSPVIKKDSSCGTHRQSNNKQQCFFSQGNKDVQVGCDHELCEAISCATLVVCCCVAVWGTHGVGSK